jgi:putative endonuclease
LYQHRQGLIDGFTKQYSVNRLVYYEVAEDVYSAIQREKQLKGGSRGKKIAMINSVNPEWRDLYDEINL